MGYLFNTIMVDILVLIASLFVLSYIYMKYLYTYWSRKKVPFIEPSFPFGNTKEFVLRRKCVGLSFKDMYDEFKRKKLPYGGIYSIGQPQLMINDPDLIKVVLTKEFQHFHDRDHFIDEENDPLTTNLLAQKGIKWKKLRAKLTPTFTSGKMKQMFERFLLCSELLAKVVEKEVDTDKPIDIKDILARFTTDIIGSCAFGIECNSLADPETEFRKYGIQIFNNFYRTFIIRMLSGTSLFLVKLLKIRVFSPDVTNFFSKLVEDIVEYREKNNVQRNDIMNMLIQLKNNKKIDDNEVDDLIKTEYKDDSDGLAMGEVVAQTFIFFLAGFETSSSTMTFALFELAANQDIQKKLRQEIDTCVKAHNNEMSYEALGDMHFLDKIIKETLRKYPVAPALNRLCVKDFKIPDSDIVVKKGISLVIPTMGLHHDPEYFPDPMKFDPGRFNEEEKTSRHQYTYLPFGEGPRICIGMRFGLLQTKLGIACLIRNFKFTLDSQTKSPLEFDGASVLLSTKDPVLLRATKV